MSKDEVRDYRSLGEVLRDAREQRNWTLEELSERTRIIPRMIQALEHDDLGQISSPVYARGFIRSLAGALGLDPEWLLSKVDLRDATGAVPESLKHPKLAVPSTPPTAPAVSERGPVWKVESVRVRKLETTRRHTVPWAKLTIMVGVVVVIAALIWAAPKVLGVLDRDGGDPLGDAAASRPLEATPGELVAMDSVRSPVPAEIDPESSASSTPAEGASRSPAPAADRVNFETVGAGTVGLSSVLSPDPERQRWMTLVVRAKARVEVIVAMDGEQPRQRVLRSGESWSLDARDHFSLQVSDADAVEVDLDGVRRTPAPGWRGDEWLLYPRSVPSSGGRP